jgi:hypothetical protein
MLYNMIKKLLISMLFAFPSFLWGQSYGNDDTHRRIIITQGDSLIETTTLQIKSPKARINPDLVYYWYENNRIHSNQGGFSGWMLDGEYRIYTLTEHALIGSGHFRTGLKDGEWKSWDQKGRLVERVNWKEGMLNGDRFFYINGVCSFSEQYKNGLLNGKVKKINPDGSVNEKFYKNGKETARKSSKEKEIVKTEKKAKDNSPEKVRTKKTGKKKEAKDPEITSGQSKNLD